MNMSGIVDAEERDILARFERGEVIARPDAEPEIAAAREAARNTLRELLLEGEESGQAGIADASFFDTLRDRIRSTRPR